MDDDVKKGARHFAAGSEGEMRPARGRLERVLPWLIGGLGLASFLRLVQTSYFIRAYSDSYNWLDFARNFSREFTQSRWPYGFPLFLRAALEVAGPYYVYLVNLPVMLVLFGLTAWMSRFWHDPARRSVVPAGWAFLSVWVVVLAADAVNFTRYINPYRDPLSYVLLLAATSALVISLARRRMTGIAGAGVLLGLATSVREPSVLMIIPLGLYGLWAWREAHGDLPFWRTVLSFLAGLGVSLVPLVWQTYVTTQQILLPPQAAIETQVIPGAHFNWATFSSVGGMAWDYYVKNDPWLLVLAGAGLLTAFRRRQPLILALVLPAAVVYAAFYSFYWTFFFRYFYIVALFLVLMAGYGIHAALEVLATWQPGAGRKLGWGVLALAAMVSGGRVLQMEAKGPLHQVPQARAMVRELAAVLPENAIVFAPRHLCEWLDWFMPCRSYALPLPHDPRDPVPAQLQGHLEPLLKAGVPLFAAYWPYSGMPQGDTVHLRRLYDLEPVASFDPSVYHAREYAAPPVHIQRIQPWRHRRAELEWTAPRDAPCWFILDLGHLEAVDATDSPVTLVLDGKPHPCRITRGGAFVGGGLPTGTAGAQGGTAVLESDRLLPGEIRMMAGPLDEPMELNMGFFSPFDHSARWSGDVIPATAAHQVPRVTGLAELDVPVPLPETRRAVLEWRIVGSRRRPDAFHRIGFFEGDQRLATAEIPMDRNGYSAIVPLPYDPMRETRRIRIVLEDEPETHRPSWQEPAVPEIHRVLLHRPADVYPVRVQMGSESDSLYVVSGFSRREGSGQGAYRWTAGRAEMSFELPAADGDLLLRIGYSTESIPAGVESGPVVVCWNGQVLTGEEKRECPESREVTWEARVPAVWVNVGQANRVEWSTPAWTPAAFGAGDTRWLGVKLRRVEIAPAAGQ